MNKKLFTIVLVVAFLIASVSFISAADTLGDETISSHGISVQIKWEDVNDTSKRPDFVEIDLIKNGNVVETKILNSSNSWSATFEVPDDGSYSIKQKTKLSDYSVSTIGDEYNGFMIINTLKSDVLGVGESDDTNNLSEENEEIIIAPDNTTYNETMTENNATDVNTTDNNSTDENSTDKESNTTIVTKTQNTTKVIKQVTKIDKKPKNVTKTQLRNTGIPIIFLVVVAFAAAFVPFSRKK
jgi:phage terminase large subunit-like protein